MTGATPRVGAGDFNNPTDTLQASERPLFTDQLLYQGDPYGARHVMADFDGDGRPDIMLVQSVRLPGPTSFMRGRGDGTFEPPSDATPSPTQKIEGLPAVADLNADGKPDLVLNTNIDDFLSPNQIVVVLGNGDGTLGPPNKFVVAGPSDRCIPVIGDFDGDHRVDVAVFGASTSGMPYSQISVLFGKGDGAFEPAKYIETWTNISGLAAGDLNDDGRDDLVVTHGPAESAGVWRYRGDRSLEPIAMLAPSGVVMGIADVDADGDLDATFVDDPRGVRISRNPGDGILVPEPLFVLPSGEISEVRVADLDGDGLSEVLVGWQPQSFESATTLVLSQSPGPALRTIQELKAGSPLAHFCVGDFDVDGHPDLVSISGTTSYPLINRGLGDGTLDTQDRFPAGADPAALAEGDVDEDGHADLVVANPGTQAILLFKGVIGGFSPAGTLVMGDRPEHISLTDLDADGHLDLLAISSSTSANQFRGRLSFFKGHGDGTFGSESVLQSGIRALAFAVFDADLDGDKDIVVSNSGQLRLLQMNPAGVVARTSFIPATPGSIFALAAADLDRDGIVDLAFGSRNGGHPLNVLRGLGDGTFAAKQTLDDGYGGYDLAVGDIDADGFPDLAMADDLPNNAGGSHYGGLLVFFGRGDGTFESARIDPTFSYLHPRGVITADLNADGREDVAVVDQVGFITVVVNHGDRFLSEVGYYVAESGAADILPLDVDGDQRPDLVVANQFAGSVSILPNRGPRSDEDGDGMRNSDDPCTDSDGDGFGDPGYAANICPLDNCPNAPNAAQADSDADGFGDACDPCIADPLNDEDRDGRCAPVDRCPAWPDPRGGDRDADGVADACDNCLWVANFDQTDVNHDGFGDACQPIVNFRGVSHDASGSLVVALEAHDPQGRGLEAAYGLQEGPRPVFIPNILNGPFACEKSLPLGNPGQGLTYYSLPGLAGLGDLDSLSVYLGTACQDGEPDFELAIRDCLNPDVQTQQDTQVSLNRSIPPGWAICIRPAFQGLPWTYQITQFGFSDGGFSGILGSVHSPDLEGFDLRSPQPISLVGFVDGRTQHLRVSVSNGDTAPGIAEMDFIYDGESALVFATNAPPHAAILAAATTECTASNGALVTLDGNGSTDPDSSPGTQDDIAAYDWYEDYGTATERPLGSGASLQVTLGLGAHAVTLKVTDRAGETSTAMSSLDVVDTTPPVVDCPAAVPAAECSGAGGAYVTIGATAHDLCGGTVTLGNDHTSGGADASGAYLLGGTNVAFTGTDARGLTATCTTAVSVVDTQPPTLSLVTDPSSLWPPNHEMVPVDVRFAAQDLCGAGVRVELLSVASSEPDDAPGGDDGQTTGDIQNAALGTADASVDLRAERGGKGSGRTYTLTYRAVDLAGHATSAIALVTVPHDQGQGPEPLQMRLEQAGTQHEARLFWPAVSGATAYDVIRGDLAALRADGGILHLGTVAVLARGTTATSATEPSSAAGATPPLGGGFFYLIQQTTDRGAVGYGTESAPWPRVPDACDGGCPGTTETVATTPAGSGSGGSGIRKR